MVLVKGGSNLYSVFSARKSFATSCNSQFCFRGRDLLTRQAWHHVPGVFRPAGPVCERTEDSGETLSIRSSFSSSSFFHLLCHTAHEAKEAAWPCSRQVCFSTVGSLLLAEGGTQAPDGRVTSSAARCREVWKFQTGPFREMQPVWDFRNQNRSIVVHSSEVQLRVGGGLVDPRRCRTGSGDPVFPGKMKLNRLLWERDASIGAADPMGDFGVKAVWPQQGSVLGSLAPGESVGTIGSLPLAVSFLRRSNFVVCMGWDQRDPLHRRDDASGL